MYHYVRDLAKSRFPEIKGLDLVHFTEQINYLMGNYNIISADQMIDAIDGNVSLPENSALLTFDDAYIDHYTNVLPVLLKNKIKGCFYAPVKAIIDHRVLDVNKIHFILASRINKKPVIDDIVDLLNENRDEYNLRSNSYYFKKLAVPNRFDTAEVIFIKRLLQVELCEELRRKITNQLFNKYIDIDEAVFSRELYMNKSQIEALVQMGMHVGSHGYDHYWLNSLSEKAQARELEQSLKFLEDIGSNIDRWSMCYPYGAYNDITIRLLNHYGCRFGLTTIVDVADISAENKYTLPRIDTNDLPPIANNY